MIAYNASAQREAYAGTRIDGFAVKAFEYFDFGGCEWSGSYQALRKVRA